MYVGALGMAGPTSVPEAPVEFVDGLGIGIVSVDRVSGARNVVLAIVSSMLDALAVERVMICYGMSIGTSHGLVALVFFQREGQPGLTS